MSSNGVDIPVYLNEALFAEALNDGFKRKDIKVKNLTLKLISEGGENYCSDIYRAKVEYTTDGDEIKKIVLIVKDMKPSFSEMIPGMSKEIDMYTLMVPKMEEILGEEGSLSPKCFKATTDFNELYIFQDLGDIGYEMQDRLKGLSEEQSHVLLKRIATFHAASMVVAEKDPDLMARVGKGIVDDSIDNVPMLAGLVYGSLDHLTELIKEWDGFEEMSTKLQRLRSNYSKKLTGIFNSNQTKFKVLNHGDLWVNNMMFKTDGETCVDAKLIDLQACTYGSPGLDIHNFFTTSVPLDIGITKRYDLLRTYHKSLRNTLLQLNYSPIPTWDDVLSEIRNTEFFALQSVIVAVPIILLEKDVSKGNDLESLNDPDLMKKQRVHMYKSKRTLATTRYLLDRMNEIGVLE